MNINLHSFSGEADFTWLESLPRQSLGSDWYDSEVSPPISFSFGADDEYLWFLSSRGNKSSIHPDAVPGRFQPDLWKYDVAEFFLCNPDSGNYWEFNLSPNGAWWACAFSSPRTPNKSIPSPKDIYTQAIFKIDEWLSMTRIPLGSLLPVVKDFPGADALCSLKLAAAFILNSPNQIFLTTAEPKKGEPDFHQPMNFGNITIL